MTRKTREIAIPNFNQPFSYQIQTLSHKIQSNPFNFNYSGYQISNAQLGGTFQMGGWPQIVPSGRNQTLLVLVTSNQTPRGWGPNQLHSPPRNVNVNYYIPLTRAKKSKVNYYIPLTKVKQTRVKHLFQLFEFAC